MAIEIVNGIIHSSISHYRANRGNLFYRISSDIISLESADWNATKVTPIAS
jgi:hypothetical protein